jgi:prophage antirepressor-like protein
MTGLIFQNTHFDVVSRDGQQWLHAAQIARALGYANDNAITRIYARSADEFTPCMTEKVKLTLSGNLQKEVRIFSLRGAHLLAMFARTKVAKDFRKWVLDVLDQEVESQRLPTTAQAEDVAQALQHQRFLVSYENGQMTSIQPVAREACIVNPDDERNVLTFFREFVPAGTRIKVTEAGVDQLATLASQHLRTRK